MRRITPHLVDIFAVQTPGARRASMLLDILASFLGNDGHLHHHGSLVVELVHKLLPVLLFLQCGIESQAAALPGELARRAELIPQAAWVVRPRQ